MAEAGVHERTEVYKASWGLGLGLGLHIVTPSFWPKQITRPVQPQGLWKERNLELVKIRIHGRMENGTPLAVKLLWGAMHLSMNLCHLLRIWVEISVKLEYKDKSAPESLVWLWPCDCTSPWRWNRDGPDWPSEERLPGDIGYMVGSSSSTRPSTRHLVGVKRLLKEWFCLMNDANIIIHHISCLL